MRLFGQTILYFSDFTSSCDFRCINGGEHFSQNSTTDTDDDQSGTHWSLHFCTEWTYAAYENGWFGQTSKVKSSYSSVKRFRLYFSLTVIFLQNLARDYWSSIYYLKFKDEASAWSSSFEIDEIGHGDGCGSFSPRLSSVHGAADDPFHHQEHLVKGYDCNSWTLLCGH